MFTHIPHDFKIPLVKEQHTDKGHYYKTVDGIVYPSITTIFKLLDNRDWYPHWVTSIAKKMDMSEKEAEIECKKISNMSMSVGTTMHRYAEEYLNNFSLLIEDPAEFEIDPYTLFSNSLKPHLDEHINNIHGTECKLYSDDLGLAGTTDLIAEYDGVLSVIDFKNSRKPKTPSQIKSSHYYEQLCAYGKMWEFCTGQKIEHGVVLVVSWDGKTRPFKTKLADHEEELWKYMIRYEYYKALNTS